MALTAERDTRARSGDRISLPVAAGVIIYAGALVARDADGNAAPGATARAWAGMGRAEETVDNSSGEAGDLGVSIAKGIYRFDNAAGADEITAAHIGNYCYMVDDQSVARTNNSGARSVAGKIFDVDNQGVWVDFR